jgi:hypothetical protein
MKVLHILKSEPDETVKEFVDAFSDDDVKTVPIFEGGEVDWAALVDAIFEYDKVICWW